MALSLEILGRTVLDRTLDALGALADLDELVQSTGRNRLDAIRLALTGASASDTILICDPDRPLLTVAVLTHFLELTRQDQVATLVSPTADTYKLVRAGRVDTTLDRASLSELQGLSRFARRSLNRALSTGRGEHELEACLRIGIPIRLVPGDSTNFPVRLPEDSRVAELVLSR